MNNSLNQLALGISQNKFNGFELDQAWTDLYNLTKSHVKPIINSYNLKYGRMYNIEKEAFEEAFDSAIFKSVEGYDITKGEFISRVITVGKNLCINTLRDSRADKRKALTESMSLNVSINGDGEEAVTFQDQLVDPSSAFETIVEESETSVVIYLEKYSALNPKKEREADLIKIHMAHYEDSARKEALMNFVGEGVSWATVRKQVSRAKDNFKKYLIEEGQL